MTRAYGRRPLAPWSIEEQAHGPLPSVLRTASKPGSLVTAPSTLTRMGLRAEPHGSAYHSQRHEQQRQRGPSQAAPGAGPLLSHRG